MYSFLVCVCGLTLAQAPSEELLWPRGAPGARGTDPQDKPSITVYLPAKEKATGVGVVVCPGGGYGGLAMGHEGKEIAEWLNQQGVAAFVLKYRLGPRYRHPAPMQDAQRAVRSLLICKECCGDRSGSLAAVRCERQCGDRGRFGRGLAADKVADDRLRGELIEDAIH